MRAQAALTGGEERGGGGGRGGWLEGWMDSGLGLSRGSRAASPVLEIHFEDFPVALKEPLHIPFSGLVAEAPDVDPRHLHGSHPAGPAPRTAAEATESLERGGAPGSGLLFFFPLPLSSGLRRRARRRGRVALT